jgi:Fe2+ transport system protein FeoA
MQTAEIAPNSIPLTLLSAPMGKKLRLVILQAKPAQCQRLREMGFCESAEIVKLSQGAALVCQVCGTRLALSRELAKDILIEPVRS